MSGVADFDEDHIESIYRVKELDSLSLSEL